MARTVAIQELPKQSRVLRRPSHFWNVAQKPWQIQPICIAPVLPGETLRNLLWQARVVSDPVRNPLAGWWCEYYWFYCKHRDLADEATFVDMVLSLGTSVSGTTGYGTARTWAYKRANTVDWVNQCLEAVVLNYFRNEGEPYSSTGYNIDNVPIASVDDRSVLHSLIPQSALTAIDVDLSDAGSPGGTSVLASEIDATMRQWEFLRANNLTEMDYEQWLATYGVRPRQEEQNVPELLRYARNWQYPANTVDPLTGTPTSALSWAVAERGDKDRFFREPGFILGVCVVRPKVYRRLQRASAVELLDNAFGWLPAIMQDDPATSLKAIVGGTGPFGGVLDTQGTDDHVVDVRDLFIYGDQFVNYDPTAADDIPMVDIPDANFNVRYATETDADALFVDEDTEEPEHTATQLYVRQDGVVQLTIAGSQVDTTPAGGMRQIR